MTNYIGQSLSSVKQSRKFSEIIEATEISFHGNLAFRINKYYNLGTNTGSICQTDSRCNRCFLENEYEAHD